MPTLESCAQCGKPLCKPDAKYCSRKCYTDSKARSDIVTKPCANCGAEISGRALSFSRNRDGSICDQVFCDRSCYDAHRVKVREAREQACVCCGKQFIPPGGITRKYCSWECRCEARKAKPHNCLSCGCLFSPVKQIKRKHGIRWISANAKDGRTTCSKECHLEWIRKNPIRKARISAAFKGELHPNWRGGRKWLTDASYRGEDWKKIAERARKRDGYKCQDCGLKREESLSKFDRDLDVHHIVPFHNWPNSKQANRMSNLVTLCASCHRIAESKCAEVQFTLPLADNRSGQRPGYRRGSKHYAAKLNEVTVAEIRRRADGGEVYLSLAEEFGVEPGTISAIVQGKTWKNVALGETALVSRAGRNGNLKGEQAGNARLTEAQVIDIRQRAFDGERFDDIGSSYDLGYQGVYQIVTGKCWKHLPVLGYKPHSTHRFLKGSERGNSKVNEDDVVAIRLRHAAGEPIAAIARDYALSGVATGNIIKRITWKHVA